MNYWSWILWQGLKTYSSSRKWNVCHNANFRLYLPVQSHTVCCAVIEMRLSVSGLLKVNLLQVRVTPQMSSAASLRTSWSRSVCGRLFTVAWTRWTPSPPLHLNPLIKPLQSPPLPSTFPSLPWFSSDSKTEVCSWIPARQAWALTLRCWASPP